MRRTTQRSKDLFYLLEDKDMYATVSSSMAKIYYQQNKFREYYAAKNEAFKIFTGKEKKNAAVELYDFFLGKEAKSEFSDMEIKSILEKEKYKDYLK